MYTCMCNNFHPVNIRMHVPVSLYSFVQVGVSMCVNLYMDTSSYVYMCVSITHKMCVHM